MRFTQCTAARPPPTGGTPAAAAWYVVGTACTPQVGWQVPGLPLWSLCGTGGTGRDSVVGRRDGGVGVGGQVQQAWRCQHPWMPATDGPRIAWLRRHWPAQALPCTGPWAHTGTPFVLLSHVASGVSKLCPMRLRQSSVPNCRLQTCPKLFRVGVGQLRPSPCPTPLGPLPAAGEGRPPQLGQSKRGPRLWGGHTCAQTAHNARLAALGSGLAHARSTRSDDRAPALVRHCPYMRRPCIATARRHSHPHKAAVNAFAGAMAA